MGNRELLAMKAAFEECLHWLGGARHPFLALTDHRDLCSAKRLGPRQARWALFFTWFDFTIFYPPGSKNIMAKSLAHQHDRSPQDLSPEPIIPTSLILAPIQCDIMTEITQAHSQHPPPSSVIHCFHSSLSSGHPSITVTVQLLRNHFW